MERFQFLDKQEEFDSIHPSLLRQSVLNNNYGLYEVIPGIYQVRGFDLSDISFVRGKTGWIVFDPLVSAEPVRAAWKLFQEHVGQGLPVSAVIYSHSHADHWGGVRGIVKEADVRSGKIPVIAPRNFLEHTIAENVYAGNAMNRRLFYQYGLLLPASPHGYVGQGLGQAVSAGAVGLIAPNRLVEKEIEEIEVDGVKMVFQDTPNTEAPTEMNTYIPEMKALWMAENVIASLHNIYTLRGAPVRNRAELVEVHRPGALPFRPGGRGHVRLASLAALGQCADSGSAPRPARPLRPHEQPGAALCQPGRDHQRDSQRLRAPEEHPGASGTAGAITVPLNTTAAASSSASSGFGTAIRRPSFRCRPADSAPLYVEMMGGAEKILARGRELHDEGKYLLAQEILNKLVQAEPQNQAAKDLLADVFEQIGYQQENPGLRNSYLAAAYELRTGIPQGETADSSSPDVIRAMSTELFLNFLGIRMDSRKAEGMRFTINLITPDNGEKFLIELENATLTNIQGFLADKPDLTLTINRSDLEQTMMGAKTLEAQIADGTAKVQGDASILKQARFDHGRLRPTL